MQIYYYPVCWLNSSTAYSPIINYSWRLRYFYSLYWGINTITTISYGDIEPQNPYQVIYALICFCFSLLTYGYVVNNIIKIILWSHQIDNNFRSQLILYTTFMDNLQISLNHQYQFRQYLEYQYFKQKQRNFLLEQQMKSKLPIDLRDQLLKSAYYKIHNILSQIIFNSPSLVKLIYFLQQKKYTENQLILNQGQPLIKMYYLHKGQINLTCYHYQKQYNIISIKNEDIFLSLYEYFLDLKATYTIKTIKNSTLYFISRQKIEQEHQKFTDLRQNFKLVQYQLLYPQNYHKIFYNCYYCTQNHHWYNCPNMFPNFKDVSLLNNPLNIKHSRISIIKSNVWKLKKQLFRLQQYNNNIMNRILNRIQQKIYRLKLLKLQLRNNFDIDIHHQWKYYKSHHNLSKFKQQWNKNRRLPIFTQDRRIPIFSQDISFNQNHIFSIN